MLAGGLLAILSGAVLMRDNHKISVKGDVLTGILSGERSARLPAWTGPIDRTPVPPVQTVPLYTLTF